MEGMAESEEQRKGFLLSSNTHVVSCIINKYFKNRKITEEPLTRLTRDQRQSLLIYRSGEQFMHGLSSKGHGIIVNGQM